MSSESLVNDLRPRVIGIYGARATGKTCYLATALLGRSGSDVCGINLEDEDSRKLLNEHWEALDRGNAPPATALGLSNIKGWATVEVKAEAKPARPIVPQLDPDNFDPEKSNSTQSANSAAATVDLIAPARSETVRIRYRFSTKDYAGLIAERTYAGELLDDFMQWLEQSHGLLFFLAVDQLRDPKQAQDRLLEVDKLLERLLKSSPPGQPISVPLAILVTKWDLVSDLSGSPAEEHKKLLEFLRSRASNVAESICAKIEKTGDRAQLWPVSTFGGHENGRPITPLRPFNLHEPLAWLLQQSDEALWQKAQQQEQEALRPWLWKDYAQAIQGYQQLQQEYGITRGPVGQRVAQQLDGLRKLQRQRTLKVGGIAVAAALLLMGVIIYRADAVQYQRLRAQLQNPTQPYAALEQQKQTYVRSWNPWARLLKRKSDILARWNEYLSAIDKDFGTLENEYRSLPVDAQPNQPLRKLIAQHHDFLNRGTVFCQRYEGHYRCNEVQTWLTSVKARATKLDGQLEAVNKEMENIAEDLNKLNTENMPPKARVINLGDLISRCKAFEERHPYCPDECKVVAQYREQATTKQEQLRQSLDQQDRDYMNLVETIRRLRSATSPPDINAIEEQRNAWKTFLADVDSYIKKYSPESSATREIDDWRNEAQKTVNVLERLYDYIHNCISLIGRNVNDIRKMPDFLKELEAVPAPNEGLKTFPVAQRYYNDIVQQKQQYQSLVKDSQEFQKEFEDLIARSARHAPAELLTQTEAITSKYAHLREYFPREFDQLERLRKDAIAKSDKQRFDKVATAFEAFAKTCKDQYSNIQSVKDRFNEFRREAEAYRKDPGTFGSEVDQYWQDAHNKMDERLWQEVTQFEAQHPSDYLGTARQALSYIRNDIIKDKRHIDAAKNKVTTALQEEWQAKYREFRSKAEGVASPYDVRAALEVYQELIGLSQTREKEFPDYWQLASPQQRQSAAAKTWSEWARKAVIAQNRKVDFKTAKVNGIYNPMRLKLCLPNNAKQAIAATDWFDRKALKGATGVLPPDTQEAEIHLEVDEWFFHGNTRANKTIDLFRVCVRDRGRFTLRDIPGYSGASVEVEVNVEGYTPPELP